jgi:hypothetical protein
MRLAFVKEYIDRTGKMRRCFRKRGSKPVALTQRTGIHAGVSNRKSAAVQTQGVMSLRQMRRIFRLAFRADNYG